MQLLSHRGHHADVPENTLDAFQAAVDIGVDGIETDLRLTADGMIVLYHDRTAPGGTPVRELERRQLEEVVGHTVPVLEEAVSTWPELLWNLEVKSPDVVPVLSTRLATRGTSLPPILVTSFWHSAVAALQDLPAGVRTGLLFASRPIRVPSRPDVPAHIDTFVWDYEFIDRDLVQSARASGFSLYAYGASTQCEHDRCVEMQLDGLITDHLLRARGALRRQAK